MQFAALGGAQVAYVPWQHSSLLTKYERDPGGGRGTLAVQVPAVSYLAYHRLPY